MTMMSGGQSIVEILKAEGVKHFFGLPGGHTLNIYDGLYRNRDSIRNVLVRHEQVASNMAAGYASLTGEPGICCATAGPGATNIVSGIAEAFYGALPLIALTGRAGVPSIMRGAAQEVPQEKIFAPITKWSVRVERTEMIPEIMRQAFTVARSGKPGPVLVDIPWDLLMHSFDFGGYVPVGKPPQPRGDSKGVEAAVRELLRAKQPIIVSGGGTVMSGAFEELRQFAETFAVPVLTTLSGRGSLPDDHPLGCGGLGMHRNMLSKKLLNEADFVLGLGCRFEQFETNWKPGWIPSAEACYVQVDSDPKEIGRAVIPKIGIISDIKLVLEDMMKVARELGGPDYRATFRTLPKMREIGELKGQVEADVRKAATRDDKPLYPGRVVRTTRDVFPRETTVAVDIGCLAQAMGGAFPYFSVYEPRSIIPCTSFYCMGYAASAAPVAKLVYPERPAVAFCGDGSFGMIMNVLPAAAENHLPVTWCVLDDGCLGSIKFMQEGMFNHCFSTAFTVRPDFAAIAKACECYGEKVEEPDQIKPALGRALEANNKGMPAVLDFRTSSEGPEAALEYFGSL
jgi:acetolactate synthase-1/2/3 large subunit